MKRTPLRRRRRKPAAVIQADIWREGLGPCVVCHHLRVRLRDRVDGHHIVPAQTLRRHGLHDYLMDKRNRMAVCRSHHESHHSAVIPITREMLPDSVFAFAAEVGLEWWLDRHYPAFDQSAFGESDKVTAREAGGEGLRDFGDEAA